MPDVGPSTPAYVIGDALEKLRQLPDGWAHCCVTSPPYWSHRNYGVSEQIGLEKAPGEYVAKLVAVFCEVRRVLRDDGTLWLVIGDSYASNKNLVGIPWRVAFALQEYGWTLRSDIVWYKSNPQPESVSDRPTRAHEYIFMLTKGRVYYYDQDAVREPHATPLANRHNKHGKNTLRGQAAIRARGRDETGAPPTTRYFNPKGRNRRDVWEVAVKPYARAHFATFPPDLIEPCILAGCPPGGIVLDPFMGAGTTGMVAQDLGRTWYGIELNPEYAALIEERTAESKK